MKRNTATNIGGLIGGGTGYLFRPSNILTGQLDFITTITAGTNLQGFDMLLKNQAVASFQMVLGGLIFGSIIGFLAYPKLKEKTQKETTKV